MAVGSTTGALGADNAVVSTPLIGQSGGVHLAAGTLAGTVTAVQTWDGVTWQATNFLDPHTGAVVSPLVLTNPNAAADYGIRLSGGAIAFGVQVHPYSSGTLNATVTSTSTQVATPTQQIVTFATPGANAWVVPAGVATIRALYIIGAGGGGGGGQASNNTAGGGGGGAGDALVGIDLDVTPGATTTFTVGAGGTAGTIAGAGGAGGASSISGTSWGGLSVAGGGGGAAGAAGTGGTGGTPAGGAAGTDGTYTNYAYPRMPAGGGGGGGSTGAAAGNGGGSPQGAGGSKGSGNGAGGGGAGSYQTLGANGSAAGVAGGAPGATAYGAGGGGGGANAAGGVGRQGYIEISYWA